MQKYTITQEQLDILKQLASKQQLTKDFLVNIAIIEEIQKNPLDEVSK